MSKSKLNILFIILILVLVGSASYFVAVKKSPNSNQQNKINDQPAQPYLDKIFDLDKKELGTKVYYSEKLGVGFTYLSYSSSTPVNIKETDNKISVADQTIEVFAKNPNISLEQAIREKFLLGYNPNQCFVKNYEENEQELPNYVSAGISFPPTDNPESPWWQNADKCPKDYSETNGIQYFIMSDKVPNKFIFVKIGQYSAASDGTPKTENNSFNWSHSIRIIK